MLEFILGILFASYIMPLLDSLVSILMTWAEVKKGKMSVQVAKYNEELTHIGEEIPDPYPIGFQAPTYVEEDEYDED